MILESISAADRNFAVRGLSELVRPSVAWAFWGEFLPTLLLLLATWWLCAIWLFPMAIHSGGWGYPIYLAGCGLLAVWILRLFVVQHDAGHNALSQSTTLNGFFGHLCSVFEFTPFLSWHRHHWHHHLTSGNLDSQDGLGDIFTLTVDQFRSLADWQQVTYRFIRSRCWFLALMPTGLFLILQRMPLVRFPFSPISQKPSLTEWINILTLDLIYLAIGWLVFMNWAVAAPWAISYCIAVVTAATLGILLFYTQHQFESTYYERESEWSFTKSAMQGSMTLRLPYVWMEWAVGHIIFHSLHHLKPNIPMYNLGRCYAHLKRLGFDSPECKLGDLWQTFNFVLWDEQQQRMISFAEYEDLKTLG